MSLTSLNQQEQLSLALRGLYQSYGYRQYKVSKFEEYDLYAQNKNFLDGEHVLTFSDTNGTLMALKPDVTLSIIKNTRDDDRTRKMWYTENVYRVPRGAYGFQEIMQTGLECIGHVDLYAMAEVLMLAARSLECISSRYVLDLSHMGILTGILTGLAPELSSGLIADISGKNLHSLRARCRQAVIPEDKIHLLESLCRLGGPAEMTLPTLLSLPLPEESLAAARELASLCALLRAFGDYNINIDMSVTNDTDYYNGVIFRGFVDGVAAGVLSGGRYDHLLHRMDKSGGAIGFAVYLSELERLLSSTPDYDVDTLLVYDAEDDPASVAAAVREIAASGLTVRAQLRGVPAVTYRRLVGPDGREAQA